MVDRLDLNQIQHGLGARATTMLTYFRVYIRRKHVRPWSLSAPVLVLLICLPLVQPFLRPGRLLSDEESSRYAMVQSLVEFQTFSIEQTQFKSTPLKTDGIHSSYSNRPPTQAVLLAGPYWVMVHAGITFKKNPLLVQYLLTVIGVTVPVALAAGMVYRMGRLFELRRPWRAGLAAASVFGSGLVSYATVLNPYAAAAALVLGSVAILVQVGLLPTPVKRGGAYLMAAGFFAALAAAIDPAAVVFTLTFPLVILAHRWSASARIGGVLMYSLGALPPVALHLSLSFMMTGGWTLGLVHSSPVSLGATSQAASPVDRSPSDPAEDVMTAPPSGWQTAWTYAGRIAAAVIGSHGILSHFPIVIVGLVGLGNVLRRHWPLTTKMLAGITLAAAAVVMARYIFAPVDWRWGMFAMRWFVLFMPMLVFWAGGWCRKNHPPAVWAVAAVLLGFGVIVSVIGAVDPMPKTGYDRYTPWGVIRAVRSGE